MEKKAMILRIERLSPNDGPGLRLVVFFKGCPLKCVWCSTPESQKAGRELYYQKSRCSGCGRCAAACPAKAIGLHAETNAPTRNRRLCAECMTCSEVCPNSALKVYGEEMTVRQVMKHIRREEVFYFHSNGGVTLSGGDVLQYAEFARELLIECRESGIHTMAELDMFGDYSKPEMLIPHLSAFFVDIKMMDAAAHKKLTGQDNKTILENIKRASLEFQKRPMHVRIPLIPKINDDRENLAHTIEYCRGLANCRELEFLPYHRLGQSTYEYLGRKSAMLDTPPMSYDEAYGKAAFVVQMKLPFAVKIAGQTIWKPE